MQFKNVTCPHCGLLCDDLTVDISDLSVQLTEKNHPCSAAFANASLTSTSILSPQIKNHDATQEQALEKAAELLRSANLPLVSGLIVDVQANREALALSEKIKGVIDHTNGQSIRNSLAVTQRIGDVKTTLSEVRNRADCIVIFGSNVLAKFPRFLERVLSPEKTLNEKILGNKNATHKKIFILDVSNDGTTHCETDGNISHIKLNYPVLESLVYRFQEVVTRPKEYFIEHNSETDPEHDEDTQQLFKILETITNSQYTTIVWSTSNFNSVSAEHTVQALTESVKTLMKKVRCVALPLGGSKGEVTANHVATWQTGVPLPVSFTQGSPAHNSVLNDGDTLLKNAEADCLLWIASFSPDDIPPIFNLPTIVLGHPNMKTEDVDVFLPVGIPVLA